MQRRFWLGLVITFLLGSKVFAASGSVDFFQQMGKMYVVVAVISVILIGLAFFLYRLDQRISKLEKRLGDE